MEIFLRPFATLPGIPIDACWGILSNSNMKHLASPHFPQIQCFRLK